MTKPNTPDRIYLIDSGEGIQWCEDPDPGLDMKAEDAVEYVRANLAGYVSKQAFEHMAENQYQIEMFPTAQALTDEFSEAIPMALYAIPVGQMGAGR